MGVSRSFEHSGSTVKSFTALRWAIGIASLLAILWLVRLLPWQHPDAVPHPLESKLMEITAESSRTNFVAPEGDLFNFVLGAPKSSPLSNGFYGSVSVISSGTNVYQNDFAPVHLKECNWLDKAGLQGYIITWNDSANLDAVLKARQLFEVTLTLSKKPEPPISLWLTFHQSGRTYRQQRTN